MGTDRKTPLSEVANAAPGRSQKAQQRSKVARTRLFAGGAVVLAIVGGAAFLATRGSDGGGVIGGILGGTDEPVPEVTLTVDMAAYEPTSADADTATQQDTADKVSQAVARSLEDLLRTAYVDPDTWDDPGAIDDMFTGEAAEHVEDDIAILTLGEDAGDVYASVEPDDGTVTVKVLTGSKGEALRAYAKVTFSGLAEHDDGTYTTLKVVGSYFLVHDDGEWRIESYRVDRQDKRAKAPATPTASGSATPSEEATG